MDLIFVGLFIAGIVLFLLAAGVWIGAALGFSGVLAYFLYDGFRAIESIGYLVYNTLSNYDLVSMPLFIYMATVLSNSGLTKRIYTGTSSLFARLPGGLLHANIMAGALFASVCGSTAATCAAISTIALPEMEKRNYPESLSIGTLAAAGTLGPMIPPGIGFIIYGVMTETSIGQLFIAGIIPGIILAVLFSIYIIFRTIIKNDVPGEVKSSFKITIINLLNIWPVLVLFLTVLGVIYTGVCTAVEAGGIGCAGALIVAAIFKQLNLHNLKLALQQATKITTLIFLVLLGGVILGHGLSNFGVPQYLVSFVTEGGLSRNELLLALTIFYVVLGCFLDGAAVLVVTLPIVFPVVSAVGIDRIWFGVLVVVFTEIAAITPPVGVNLFVLQGVTKKPLEKIMVGVLPFIGCLLLFELLLIIFPEMALFLPKMMY
jgi:C4-dicarboxylate transporter, DctM subunit